METLPGKELMCMFMEVDEEGQRLVLSARRRVDRSAKGMKARGGCLLDLGALMALADWETTSVLHHVGQDELVVGRELCAD